MRIFSTRSQIQDAIMKVGDLVQILGTSVEGDDFTRFGKVREADYSTFNSTEPTKNGLKVEIFPDAVTNFKGDWSNLTGSLSVPASVYHEGDTWQLLVNLVDVTTSEPGVTSDWASIGYVTKAYTVEGEKQRTGLVVHPVSFSETAAIGDTINAGTNALRNATTGTIYRTSEVVSGEITDVDYDALTATIGGVTVALELYRSLGANRAIIRFDNVARMVSDAYLSIGDVVHTLGYTSSTDEGGNTYEIVASGTGVDDGGSFIDLPGSEHQAKALFSGGDIHPAQFGFPVIQASYDNYLSYLSSNEEAKLVDGKLIADVNTEKGVEGQGVGSILQPANSVALTLERHITSPAHDWTRLPVRNFTIKDSSGMTKVGVNFGSDPFSGRYLLDTLHFQNLDKGIEKSTGNIGNVYDNNSFRNVNYGLHATSDPNPMHSGADTMLNAHFDGVEKACVYVNDSIDGSGGYIIRDSIAEQCNGFFLFGDFGNNAPFTPPTLENVWMEQVALAATTEIDSVTYNTRQIYLKDCPMFVMKELYLQSMQLINTVVHATNIRIDDAVQTPDFGFDLDSALIVDDLYSDGVVGEEPFVRSISKQLSDSNTKNLSVRGPLALKELSTSNYSGANVYSENFAGVGPWTFSISGGGTNDATSVSDGVINDTCAEITVPAGEIHYDQTNGTPSTDKWVVWSVHAKAVSGDLDNAEVKLAFNMTLGDVYLRSGQWVRSYGIQKTNTVGSLRLYVDNSTSASDLVMRFGDVFVREFNTLEEAQECVNGMLTVI